MKIKTLSLALVISLSLAILPATHAQGPAENVHFTVPAGTRVVLEAPTPQPSGGCAQGGIFGWLHKKCGPKCWGHHDEIVTGNCHSEGVFMFGSSRAYFGEPCRPIPPGAYGCGQGRYGIAPYANSNCTGNGSPGVAGPAGVGVGYWRLIGVVGGGSGSLGCANGSCDR